MAAPRIVNCPTCGEPVEWKPENRWRPFCSERCRLLDLGQWANEGYRIPESHDGDEPPDAAVPEK